MEERVPGIVWRILRWLPIQGQGGNTKSGPFYPGVIKILFVVYGKKPVLGEWDTGMFTGRARPFERIHAPGLTTQRQNEMEVKNIGILDKSGQVISVAMESDTDFETARQKAREEAGTLCPQPLMLSWYNKNTGEFYPKVQCGSHKKPVWQLYAESRGSDITVEINGGMYVFMFLSAE